MFDYLKYSGCNVIIKLNPLHWNVGGRAHSDVFDGKTYELDLVMITIRLWLDNGDW